MSRSGFHEALYNPSWSATDPTCSRYHRFVTSFPHQCQQTEPEFYRQMAIKEGLIPEIDYTADAFWDYWNSRSLPEEPRYLADDTDAGFWPQDDNEDGER